MRVLHVTSGNMYGGVETFLTTLQREALAAPGMLPEFAVCFDGRLRSELETLGGVVRRLPSVRFSRPLSVLSARSALADLLKRESYDVVVCHQPWTCVAFGPVIRAAAFPVVLWVHMAGDGRHWLDRLCRLTGPDLAICNSDFAYGHTAGWLRHTAIERVYYPLSASGPVSRQERTRLRDALETSDRDVVLVQVSRLESWKGQHVLLAALGALRDTSGWTCWIVGGAQRPSESRYLAELKALACESGIERRVRFLGERSDVPAILGSADVFCQPNTTPEPFGLSLVEAQRAGLPIVTSGIGGALEIVDGTCGVLTSPGDVHALSNALRRLILDHDVRTGLSAQAPSRADERCNAPRQIRRIEAVLATTITRPRVVPRPVQAGSR